jgi:hypothetical protein
MGVFFDSPGRIIGVFKLDTTEFNEKKKYYTEGMKGLESF